MRACTTVCLEATRTKNTSQILASTTCRWKIHKQTLAVSCNTKPTVTLAACPGFQSNRLVRQCSPLMPVWFKVSSQHIKHSDRISAISHQMTQTGRARRHMPWRCRPAQAKMPVWKKFQKTCNGLKGTCEQRSRCANKSIDILELNITKQTWLNSTRLAGASEDSSSKWVSNNMQINIELIKQAALSFILPVEGANWSCCMSCQAASRRLPTETWSCSAEIVSAPSVALRSLCGCFFARQLKTTGLSWDSGPMLHAFAIARSIFCFACAANHQASICSFIRRVCTYMCSARLFHLGWKRRAGNCPDLTAISL